MISKEEMYEFASQIAGITDSDLEAYRGGGKTTKRKVVSSKGKPAWVAPAGPIANSRIHGDKNGEDFYESGTPDMMPTGITMTKKRNGDWVQKYPNGNTRTYVAPKRDKNGRIIPGSGDPDYEYVNRVATKNHRQSLRNYQKNGISLDQEKCGGKMKKHK